ncbi:MAG: amidohydrolase, partial [Verrucomicrobia bacterium]
MNRIAAFLFSVLLVSNALAEKISLVGGTVINPADGKVVENAVVVINGNKIESVASRNQSGVAGGSRRIECDNKFVLPGYIDTHVHFFQSADLFTRPDAADLNSV